MLKEMRENQFDNVYAVMQESFPLDEFRSYAAQKALLQKSAYRIYVYEKEEIRGFLAAYEWEDLLFIEHFAVDKRYRNLGLGGKMLGFLLAQTKKTVCLEVELPQTELAQRRIAFYGRNGFVFNEYAYMQPSIEEGKQPVELRLMSYPRRLEREEFLRIKNRLYTEVYGRQEGTAKSRGNS